MLDSRPPTASDEPAADQAVLLELQAVDKRWGPRLVLDGLGLTLRSRRSARIRGANGAGKTTLLRIAVGLVRPDSGTVRLCGQQPEEDRASFLGRLGFCSAGDRGLYARLSARQHLSLATRLALMPPRDAALAVEETLHAFGLEPFADRRVERTSMGQRQRTRLALAFVSRPDVVLLDEPANSLDDDGIERLSGAIDAVRTRGGAVLCAVPSTAEAPLLFDERLVLTDGRLAAE